MDTNKFYESYAEKGFMQVNSEKVGALAKQFLKSPVLDIGCYFGQKTAFLSKHFEKVEGCDISKTAIEKAKKANPKLKFFQCNFEQENLNLGKKYNSLFAAEVIEHVFDTEAFLKNCFKALNKGGILLVTTPNAVHFLNRLRVMAGDESWFSGDKAHIRFFKPNTIKKEVEKAGFKVIKMAGYNVRPSLKKAPMPLNWQEGTVVIAKK
jgi:2-polyprenyl-3-methyl-5-hydroxy-6-metoxy-1,4-benzoquinol methylase